MIRATATSTVDFIRDALEQSRARLVNRLRGIEDAEYFWEPVAGCWSVRRRSEAVTKLANGRGEWVCDHDLPDPDPAPLKTIAWRLIFYDEQVGRWLGPLGRMADDDLQRLVVVPWWPEAAPLAVIYRVILDENAHHGAEAGVLRELYQRIIRGATQEGQGS